MENDAVDKIVPAEGDDGGISEETKTAVTGADEQPVTSTVSAVVIDEQQPNETTAVTSVPVVEQPVTTAVSAAVLADDEQKPNETTPLAFVVADKQKMTTDEQQQEGATALNGGVEVAVATGGGGEEFRVSRKRGRPRKEPAELMAMVEFSESAPPQKRGRGRPKGSGKLQRLQEFAASFGNLIPIN